MDRSSHLVHATLALSVLAIVGCGSPTSAPKSTGSSITVTITSADGSAPSVVVSGPNSYHKVISTTQSLNGLADGNYTIVAESAVVPDSVVGTITDSGHVTGSPATVTTTSDAQVTVVYATKDRVGGMWVANAGYGTLPELASSQLRTSGALVPADILFTPTHSNSAVGLALDAAGNMWESETASSTSPPSFGSGDSLLMYSVAARNAGTPPTRVITSLFLTNSHTLMGAAGGIAFDVNGNLWVIQSFIDGPALYEFSVAQLAAGGQDMTPAGYVVLSSSVGAPENIAFDANGNAWVTDGAAPHVVEYSAAQLASGSITSSNPPHDTIGMSSWVGRSPTAPIGTAGVAVDENGNLWISSGNTLAEYTPAMQVASGSPTPNAVVTLPPGANLWGLAFDNRGSLWAADLSGHIYGLTKAQLSTGAPTPAVSISLALVGSVTPLQLLFDKYATASAPAGVRLRSLEQAKGRR